MHAGESAEVDFDVEGRPVAGEDLFVVERKNDLVDAAGDQGIEAVRPGKQLARLGRNQPDADIAVFERGGGFGEKLLGFRIAVRRQLDHVVRRLHQDVPLETQNPLAHQIFDLDDEAVGAGPQEALERQREPGMGQGRRALGRRRGEFELVAEGFEEFALLQDLADQPKIVGEPAAGIPQLGARLLEADQALHHGALLITAGENDVEFTDQPRLVLVDFGGVGDESRNPLEARRLRLGQQLIEGPFVFEGVAADRVGHLHGLAAVQTIAGAGKLLIGTDGGGARPPQTGRPEAGVAHKNQHGFDVEPVGSRIGPDFDRRPRGRTAHFKRAGRRAVHQEHTRAVIG